MEINKKTWSGSSGNTQKGYSIFLWIIDRLGRKTAYFLLFWVALSYWLFHRKANKSLHYLYKNRLQFSFVKAHYFRWKNYYTFGQSLIDKVDYILQPEKEDWAVQHEEGRHYFEEILQNGQGGILMGAHLGTWDIAGQMLANKLRKVNVVMFDGERAGIKELLEEKIGRPLYQVIYIDEQHQHLYDIQQALNRNELVCFLADRFIEGQRTQSLDFLDAPASFPEGPFYLAALMKVPVCFVHGFKIKGTQYSFKAQLATPAQGVSTKERAQLLQKEYVTLLAQQLKLHPEQWFNYYHFWD